MIQVLAGLVGGALALIGVFLAQALTARAARRQRIATLGAQYLAEGAMAMDYLSMLRRAEPDDPANARVPADEVPHLGVAITAGSELGLICGKATALQVNAVAGTLSQLTLLALPWVADQDWYEAVIEFGHQRLQLTHALRRELGRPAMTDDELGHDAPDVDDPRSTHTP